jgi:hypothetical protein
MKFIKSIQVLAVIFFVAANLSQVWAEFNSVDFSSNGTVYYQSGATEDEAEKLAAYLQECQMDNADLKIERDSKNAMVVSIIPGPETSAGDLREISVELEQNVFGERVVMAACDDEFHVIYKVNDTDLLEGFDLSKLPEN